MLEELRKDLGVPLEQDTDGQDYGYRSTLSMNDLESRYNEDILDDVPVQHAASPPHRSPPRGTHRHGSDVGRPPLPRHGSGRSVSPGTGSKVSIEVQDSNPQQINVLTIDSEFENTNQNSYSQRQESALVESDDGGYDEVDASVPRGRVTPSSTRSMTSPRNQPGFSSSARRRHSRREKNSFGTALLNEQPSSLDVDVIPNGVTTDDLPSPDDQNHPLALDKTRTIEVAEGLENGDVGRSGSVSYRNAEHEDNGVDIVERRDDDYDDDDYDDDADSYGAYDTNEQLLDTLTEYQQKLEKTNFVDEADEDAVEDTVTELDRTAPVPLPRRQISADQQPESTNPPEPQSPSDSLDVSELEEDEYLEY